MTFLFALFYIFAATETLPYPRSVVALTLANVHKRLRIARSQARAGLLRHCDAFAWRLR